MITTANYIVKVVAEGETYVFEYDTADVWKALDEFWHEDWDDWLSDKKMTKAWPLDVMAMDDGKVIKTYELAFEMSYFHYYYDHGRITLDEFHNALLEIRKKLDAEKPNVKDVTSFFYYMWNKWSEEECKVVFNDPHFWNKWCEAYDTMKGPRGAAELFYMMLSDTNRDKLVKRALECYDGMTEK